MSKALWANAIKLKHMLDIYDLDRELIAEPTEITLNSSALIYLCFTNSTLKIIKFGVV